jgi:hypothetical protein
MSVVESVLNPKQPEQKVISPRMHGVIDYAHAAFFLGMALACRKRNKPAAAAALGTGALLLAQALLTDYPLGAKPVIPFALHGKMDAAFASASWAIPKVFGFSGTAAAKVFEMNSGLEGTIAGMTDYSSERARVERFLD